MIPGQGKENPQQFSFDSNQCLHSGHSFSQMPLIRIIHNSAFAYRIESRKKEDSPKKRPASFGDMTIPFVFSRTDLKEVQPSHLQDFRKSMEFTKISDLPDQPGCRNLSYPFQRQNRMTIRDLWKKGSHLLFQLLHKLIGRFDPRKNFLDFKENRLATFL